jgi:energy-coupling factor transporter ATP-binding protein EcfA2
LSDGVVDEAFVDATSIRHVLSPYRTTMPQVEARVSCPVYDSFRVQQVAGLFDVPLAERATAGFSVEVPAADEPWQIGLIVGPSGSGKSTIARAAFGDRLYAMPAWPEDRAVVDGFGELPMKTIVGLLTAVGFSSPPAWIKPYRVLSGGERFRCDLARAIASALDATGEPPLVVFDEFTSVVDRQVAQVGSAAIAKAVRGGLARVRFVAVSCHHDVAEWLEPDWVVDMATRGLQRRRLRRPAIELEVYRCRRSLWKLFAAHHYLSGSLSFAARCYAATWRGRPVSFCATLPLIGQRGYWRISRMVTLPDYQGIGIGMRVAEAVAQLYRDEQLRIGITASHPAVIAHCRRSPAWRTSRVMKTGSRKTDRFIRGYRSSAGRAVVSFEYLGASAAAAQN